MSAELAAGRGGSGRHSPPLRTHQQLLGGENSPEPSGEGLSEPALAGTVLALVASVKAAAGHGGPR